MARPARRAVQQVEAGGMIETNLSDSAVALMCWDNGGMHLVGLMVVRREDGHACFVELPPELEQRLETLDRQFVADNAAQLLKLAYDGLSVCEFAEEDVISREFLQQGHCPATAGTMRHIPAERIPGNLPGIETWQTAGFIVDVGEIDLTCFRGGQTYH